MAKKACLILVRADKGGHSVRASSSDKMRSTAKTADRPGALASSGPWRAGDGADPLVTLLLTDNLANQKVSQNAQSATRSRYFLIRSACLHQRIADGERTRARPREPVGLPLTKFIGAEKTASSIAYLDRQAASFRKGGCRRGRRGVREVREVPCDAAMAG